MVAGGSIGIMKILPPKKNKNNELKLGREIEPMASSHSLKRWGIHRRPAEVQTSGAVPICSAGPGSGDPGESSDFGQRNGPPLSENGVYPPKRYF